MGVGGEEGRVPGPLPLAVGVVSTARIAMEQPLTAHKAGTVTGLTAEKGATVSSGTVLCEIKD
jgi:acetyl-CoA/propionyl-CoA carboxylase biotin carboxyl carrier protein